MNRVSAFLMGFLFALGLLEAQMTDPKKVIAFLQLGPQWSENLMFVMLGALLITMTTFPLILRRTRPVFESAFHIQNPSAITRSVWGGALIFGIGWGLSGYCPGPLIVGLASLKAEPWICFLTFLLGQWLSRHCGIQKLFHR